MGRLGLSNDPENVLSGEDTSQGEKKERTKQNKKVLRESCPDDTPLHL